MNLSINLYFNGNCHNAFQYYEEHLNGTVGLMLRYCDSPVGDTVDADWQEKILHGNLQLGNVELSGTDLLPRDYKAPQGFFILLSLCTEKEIKSYFNALAADGGQTIMAPQQTFWSSCYAMVVDKFGVPWKLNCTS